MQKNFLSLCLLLMLVFAVTSFGQDLATDPNIKVVLNEVNTDGTSDMSYFEITNLGAIPADISGWLIVGSWQNGPVGVGNVLGMDVRHEIGSTGLFAPNAAPTGTVAPLDTVLLPGESLVIEEVATNISSSMPAGTKFETMQVDTGLLAGIVGHDWFSSVPLQVALYDHLGNGADYWCGGGVQLYEVPFELGTFLTGLAATPTPQWATVNGNAEGSPVYQDLAGNDVPFGRSQPHDFRHQITDTDGPLDWTNEGAAAIIAGTPGLLNSHQYNIGLGNPGTDPWVPAGANQCVGGGAPVIAASFTVSSTIGCEPLGVAFKNTSTGVCDPAFATWDLDVLNVVGGDSTTEWHAFRNLSAPGRTVNVTVIDAFGGASTAANQVVTVNPVPVITPRTLPLTETFENFPALVADPCGGAQQVPAPTSGFSYVGLAPSSRFRTDNGGMFWNIPFVEAHPAAGPTVLELDSTGGNGENNLAIHFDIINVPAGTTGFEVRYWMMENFDENHPQDVFVLTDGQTGGNAVTSPGTGFEWTTGGHGQNGTVSGGPGFGGHAELLVHDWNPNMGSNYAQRQWFQFTHTFDIVNDVFGNGMLPNTDMRFVFKQLDNVCFGCNDAIALDLIQIIPLPINPLPGNPVQPGVAVLDINGSANVNGDLVLGATSNINGPFFANSTGLFTFTFEGGLDNFIILIAGPLAVNSQAFPAQPLQIDVGSPQVVSDGLSSSGFLPQIFRTSPVDGSMVFSMQTGANNLGVIGAFQAIYVDLSTPVPGVAFSNCVEITLN